MVQSATFNSEKGMGKKKPTPGVWLWMTKPGIFPLCHSYDYGMAKELLKSVPSNPLSLESLKVVSCLEGACFTLRRSPRRDQDVQEGRMCPRTSGGDRCFFGAWEGRPIGSKHQWKRFRPGCSLMKRCKDSGHVAK